MRESAILKHYSLIGTTQIFFVSFRQLSQKSKTFYYHFDHLGSFSIADLYIEKTMAVLKKFVGIHTTSGLGVCHADDLMFLFRYLTF